MTTKEDIGRQVKNRGELKKIIDEAIQRIGGSKENDVCKYLPVPTGGYMHHFTFRKMKSESPGELSKEIDKHILGKSKDKLKKVAHKPRRPRGSRRKHDVVALTRSELERILQYVRQSGDLEMAKRLSPKLSLTQIKKQLIAAVRREAVDLELWSMYVEAVTGQAHPISPVQSTPTQMVITGTQKAN